MKLHRFFIESKIITNDFFVTEPNLLHQWKNVLRYKSGDRLVVVDPSDNEYEVQVSKVDKNQVTLQVVKKISKQKKDHQVILYLAQIKPTNFELVVEKVTEIGISQISPIITARTLARGLKRERLERIIKEAGEQSERTSLPTLNEPKNFSDALAQAKSAGPIILFDPSGTFPTLSRDPDQSVGAIFIGPEGGFTIDEIDEAKKSGAQILNLGENVLRAETAAIVASYWQVNFKSYNGGK